MTSQSFSEMKIDLHLHTFFSDGAYSPEDVIKRATAVGLCAVAITDHDITDGVERAIVAGARYGVEVVPGVELSSESLDSSSEEIHILGYYINWRTPYFQKKLALFRKARLTRAHEICDRLNKLGIPINRDFIFDIEGRGAVGRMHIAKALVAGGWVDTVDEAFQRYLIKGRPAFVKKIRFLPEEAIELILKAGGIPVLAHPKFGASKKKIVKYLAKKGLLGIEAYYIRHTHEETEKFLAWAKEFNLMITGGSDCHGEVAGRTEEIGKISISYEHLFKMKEYKFLSIRKTMRILKK